MRRHPLLLAIALGFALTAGCQGVSTKDIREQSSALEIKTNRPSKEIVQCLTEDTELERLFGDGRARFLTFPRSNIAELSIGAVQMGTFKNYYLVTLTTLSDGTLITFRRSGSNYIPLRESTLQSILSSCASN